MNKLNLPIDDYLVQIQDHLIHSKNLVLTAEPGAGKTTRVPPSLLQTVKGQIWMLEPRRIAALAAAQRIAEENHWTLGQEVGYLVRLENKTSAQTRIKIITEAILNKKISVDPSLKGIDVVILDEFHERSVHADLALGLLKETQLLHRPDLIIIVMSATLDTQKVSDFLDQAPILKVPGRLFPISKNYIKESQLLLQNRSQLEELSLRIRKTFEQSQTQNTALVFLPGVPEIQFIYDSLQNWSKAQLIEIQVIHGGLDLEEQKKVLNYNQGKRLVLSTNIAETSLTLQGVDVVIDSGLAKVATYDLKTGFSRLEISRISKAAAQQREGRAGRLSAGKCFKLWNKLDETSMPAFDKPEILRSDLAETLLLLSSLGQRDFSTFSWFEKPSDHQLRQSWNFLNQLKAIDSESKITPLGLALMQIPLSLRSARLLLAGLQLNCSEKACEAAMLLQEKDFLKDSSSYVSLDCESDLYLSWWILKNEPEKIPSYQRSNINRTLHQLKQILNTQSFQIEKINREIPPELEISFMIFLTYSDRLCKRRQKNSSSALMLGRRGVHLSEKSVVKKSTFFVALDGVESSQGSDTKVNRASGVLEEWVYQYFKNEIHEKKSIHFDIEKEKFFSQKQIQFRDLPLREDPPEPCSLQDLKMHLPEALFENWDYVRTNNKSIARFLERWNYIEQINPPFEYFDFEGAILESVIQQASLGESDFSALLQKDWSYFFSSLLTPEQKQYLENLPDQLQVPSGSWISISYPQRGETKPPSIAVRLQEIFGWIETPKIGPLQIPLLIHLLAPNYRPVQVTQDLKSFWEKGYLEVKKELRIKYPKHSWPEDPLTAPAEAKGRRRPL